MKKRKKIERLVLTSIAVGISLVYLLSPVQKQAFGMLHELSHVLAALHEHSTADHGQHHGHDLAHDHHGHTHSPKDHQALQAGPVQHDHAEADHGHKLLAGAQRFFEVGDDSPSHKDKIVEIKLDKHVSCEDQITFTSFPIVRKPDTKMLPQKAFDPFLEVNCPPPDSRSI